MYTLLSFVYITFYFARHIWAMGDIQNMVLYKTNRVNALTISAYK